MPDSKWLEITDSVQRACGVILQKRIFRPSVAVVLGSGLGDLADEVQHAESVHYSEIPGFPVTHAVGHAGRLILGYINGVPVVLMQGRCHRYEGRTPNEIQFPIRVLRALGVETFIATNAAGGLNPLFQVGDLMIIDSHIDMLWLRGQPPGSATTEEPHFGRISPYCPGLMRKARAFALKEGFAIHQGCYLGTLGPTYETRSEYRFFRWVGADAVGMSTVSEVQLARALGMRVLAFSVITNVASTDVPAAISHDEVVRYGKSAGPRLLKIVRQVLEEISGQPD